MFTNLVEWKGYTKNMYIVHGFINKELYNGILLVHPILTYTAVIMYAFFFVKKKRLNTVNYFQSKVIVMKVLVISIVSILLGSLWAQQELNWGGWWSWDPVEIILLSIIFVLLSKIHVLDKNMFYNHYANYILNKYAYIPVFYLIVRSNIINSIHSFSSSTQLQKYIYIVAILILTVLLITVLWRTTQSSFNSNSKSFFKKNKHTFFGKFFENSTIKDKNLLCYFFFVLVNSSIIIITYVNIIFFLYGLKINTNLYYYTNFYIYMCILYVFVLINSNLIKIHLLFVAFIYLVFDTNLLLIVLMLSIIFIINNKFKFKFIHILFNTIALLCLFVNNTTPYLCVDFFKIEQLFNYLVNFNSAELFSLTERNFTINQRSVFFFEKSIFNLISSVQDYFNHLTDGGTFSVFGSNIVQHKNKMLICYSIIDNTFSVEQSVTPIIMKLFIIVVFLIMFKLYATFLRMLIQIKTV